MTEVFINGKLADIEGKEIITSSYGNLSFNNLSTRKGVKTNNFKIPITNNNKIIFESSELPSSASDIPYRYSVVQVVVDGYEVFTGFGDLEETQDYYEMICASGLSNFYAIIKEKLLTELDLSEFDHEYNQLNIQGSWSRTEGYNYAYCGYGQWNLYYLSGTYFPPSYLKPHIFFHTVIRTIVKDAGYTLEGDDVLSNLRLRNHMILYNNFPTALEYGELFQLSSTLPAGIKQSSLFLDFLNIYGVMLDVNEYDKIITATFIDDIIYNPPTDWSNKIDDSEKVRVKNSFDYGQSNKISFKTDDDYVGDLSTTVPIDNTKLPLTGTLYSSGFYAFVDNQDESDIIGSINDNTKTFVLRDPTNRFMEQWNDSIAAFYFAGQKVYDEGTYYEAIIDNGNSPSPSKPNANPDKWKVVSEKDIWNTKTRPMYGYLDFNDSYFTVQWISTIQLVPKMITGRNMNWAYSITNHYEVFRRVIDKTKIIEHLFKLTYADINQLDLTRPVWLDRYNNLFIIDEVEQFKLNEIDSTNVRLIRL